MNEILVHNKLKVKCQSGDAENLTNNKFNSSLENEMLENETCKNKG